MSALEVSRLGASAFVGGVAGLQLVVSAGGTRSWRLFYRVAGGDGRRRAMGLGRYPIVTLADGRDRAAKALALAANGEDPREARRAAVRRRELTVARAIDDYLATCASSNDVKTVRDKRSAFATHLIPRLGDRSLSEVKKSAVLEVIDELADRPAIQRNLFAYVRHFFGWALERDLIDAHPLLGVRAPRPGAPRDRVLTDGEIVALWGASGVTADIARLSLLTAQRKGSIEAMCWPDVDLERGLWSAPAAHMKSGRPHEVPLSSMAVEVIARQRRLGAPHVFGVGTDGAKPYAGASNGFESLRRQVGSSDWRLHDVRRTAVTLAQRGGGSIEEISALTQHKRPGVIGVYARHAYADEKRRVVELIEREVGRMLDADAGQYI